MTRKNDYQEPAVEIVVSDRDVLADAITASGDFKPSGDYDGNGLN